MAHEGERLPVMAHVGCRDTVARHDELEIAHVRVARSEEYTL
jgi:hypothetical protein